MTVPSDRLPECLAERRKNPRADSCARYKRLRGEAEPPRAIAAATEILTDWICLAVRGIGAAVGYMRGRTREDVRRVARNEISRQ